MAEIIVKLKDYLTPISLLLILVAGMIDNSKKIAWKPLTSFLSRLGKKINSELNQKLDEISAKQVEQETYLLNDFYSRYLSGCYISKEQYAQVIEMFHRHIDAGYNHINEFHLKELEERYQALLREERDNNTKGIGSV